MVWNPACRNMRQAGVARLAWFSGSLCMVVLTGCASVGPDYKAPGIEAANTVTAEQHWQAALPHGGRTDVLLNWWQRFNDPVLSQLLAHAEHDSPALDEAVARIDEARAGMTMADAGNLPVVNAGARSTRNTIGPLGTVTAHTSRSEAIDATWEIDIFGRVRRSSEMARANLEMQENGWHAARVSLAAEVAGKYVNYRACQLMARAFEHDVNSRRESARIIGIAAEAGLMAPAEAQLARASHADAALMSVAQQAACDITVKSLVTLTGFNEPELRRLLLAGPEAIPAPAEFAVEALPVALLAQRPDLAISERALAVASAEVGVATANRYPRLSLLGNLSANKTRSNDTTVTSNLWSFGPALSLPLFNGGALASQQEQAQARYEQSLARYRKAIRAAVEEVETVLVSLDSATRRADHARTAVTGFNNYFKAAEKNWRAGGISLLSLEDARRSAVAAERGEIALQRDRVLHWISLYKALGGGWSREIIEPNASSDTTTQATSDLPPASAGDAANDGANDASQQNTKNINTPLTLNTPGELE